MRRREFMETIAVLPLVAALTKRRGRGRGCLEVHVMAVESGWMVCIYCREVGWQV